MIFRKITALLLMLLMASLSHAEDIHVAVAANFTAAMKELVIDFEKNSEHRVKPSYGSSGKIYAQIRHGAPFQVFLSADQTKPLALEKDGLAIPDSRFTYAVGALVLWSAKPDFIDENLKPLKSGEFNKLAIANPKLAPYGAAAVEVLETLGFHKATQPKWVMGENIAQTYQFVFTRNADLGFVALSQVMAKGHIKSGSSWIVPSDMHQPIRQDAILLKKAADNAAARAFLKYLHSQSAKAIIHNFGYKTE